jgi:DNA-binding NarL/FixJ family response regulator
MLTDREMEITHLVCKCYTNQQIASELHICEHTVRNHLVSIFEKLDIQSRVELIRYCLTNGIVNVEEMRCDYD